MTVSTIDAGVIRIGNGVTTAFPFAFEARVATEVKVETVTDIITVPVDPNDYVVTLEPDGIGGTVTFLVAPANLVKLYVYRETAFTQLVSVASQQRYDPEVAEGVWDKLTFLAQELAAELGTAVKTAPGEDPDTLIASLLAAEEDARLAADEANASAVAAAASAADALAKQNSMLRWRGSWLTATAYAPSDIVFSSGSSYVCVIGHTSGVFATDLAAVRWALFAQQGASGGGTGDMLNSDNLSGLTNKPLALSTLGGQAASSKLTELAAPTYVRGDLIRRGAAGLERLGKGTALEVLGGDGTDSGWVSRAKTLRDTKAATGASQTFTGLLAGLEDIEILTSFISFSGGANLLVRLGTGGGIISAGYSSINSFLGHANLPAVDGRVSSFSVNSTLSAAGTCLTEISIKRVSGNIWMMKSSGYRTEDTVKVEGLSYINLGAELTQIQVSPSAGTFDNGNFYLKW